MPMPGVDELFHDWLGSDGISDDAAAMLTDRPVRPPERVRPSEEVRRLYRELVRQAHPDLAQEEGERERRDAFISRVNAAYGRGDEGAARAGRGMGGRPGARGVGARRERRAVRAAGVAGTPQGAAVARGQELEESAIGSMLRMAPEDPDRLLEEIAEQLLAQVSEREAELAAELAAE